MRYLMPVLTGNWVAMKKYAFLFAINALIFGALSGSAWMTIAAGGVVSPVTWAMAVLPLLLLAIIGLWLTPRALAALKSGNEQRAEARQERAEAHVAQTVVDDSAASRLRRVVRTAEETACEAEPEQEIAGEYEGESGPESFAAPEPEFEPEPEESFDVEPATEVEPETQGASQSQWAWLMADGAAHQLRPASETGFPWVAATIAEMAGAVIDSYSANASGDFLPEAEAWMAIASELLPTQPIARDDAQSFVGWVNDLAAHSHLNQHGVTLDALLERAFTALGERADDDGALAASLPDAVYSDQSFAQGWAKAS